MDRSIVKQYMEMGGEAARHMLLAYAYERGVPYRVLELETRSDNKPSPLAIYRMYVGSDCSHVPKSDLAKLVQPIVDWLSEPPKPELIEHNQLIRSKYMIAKAARRVQYEALRCNAS